MLRSRDLEQRGLTRSRIREAVAAGALEHVARGLYGLPGAKQSEHHSLVQVTTRVETALAFVGTGGSGKSSIGNEGIAGALGMVSNTV